MKKIATSLFAMFAVVGTASAANVINDNPLYRPDAGHFYSVTSLETDFNTPTDTDFDAWTLMEEFGYGITKDLSVILGTSFTEADTFDNNAWDALLLGLNYRVLNEANWKADVYGSLNLNPIWGDHAEFLDEDTTTYVWTAGMRGGYVAADWTLAAYAEYEYTNSEAFNWGDEGQHDWAFGLDGQYLIDDSWNIVAGLRYEIIENNPIDDPLFGKIGVNYNIDATKYVGLYTMTQLNPEEGDDAWTLGAKFGIDF